MRDKGYSMRDVECLYAAIQGWESKKYSWKGTGRVTDVQPVRDVLMLHAKCGMHGTEIDRLARGEGKVKVLQGQGAIAGTITFVHKSGRVPRAVRGCAGAGRRPAPPGPGLGSGGLVEPAGGEAGGEVHRPGAAAHGGAAPQLRHLGRGVWGGGEAAGRRRAALAHRGHHRAPVRSDDEEVLRGRQCASDDPAPPQAGPPGGPIAAT